MRYLILSLAIFFGLLINCFGGTINKSSKDGTHLEYGSKHKSVLRIFTIKKTEDGLQQRFGSCVLIDPTIIVTAAHVVINTEKCIVKTDSDNSVNVDFCVFPSAFLENSKDITKSPSDIAICHLEQPIKIDFYPKLYDKFDESGKICSIAGFGATGIHGSTKTISDGRRRAGSNIIDGIFDSMLECSINSGKNTSLEFLINVGDSGGGLFIDKKLAGINSSIYKTESSGWNNARHTRISLHKKWIDSVVKILKQYDKGE